MLLSKSYNYTDDEPIIKKKGRKTKIVKEEPNEPEVLKKIRNTRLARSDKKQVEDDEDDEEELPIIEPKKKPLSYFEPIVHPKYDEKFIDNLKVENDTLKKHIDDLKKIHSYNSSLNQINHFSHQMKIKLG